MDSKSSFEKKDESVHEESVNTQKPTNNIKRMIFHTETIQQSPLCFLCKRYKCDCKKKFPEQKIENDSLHNSSNSIPCKITSKIDKERKQNFLGNKRKTEEEKFLNATPSLKNNLASETEHLNDHHNEDNKVLDLNMLYNAVSPPSELNEEINDDISSSNNKKIRKSTRIKKEKTHVFQIFYCHQCKKSDNTFNMLICTNPACRDAYCFHCLKKYYFKGENTSEIVKTKIEEEKKDWICYMCKGKCTCKTCNKNCEISDTIKDTEKLDGKINKKPQGNSVLHTEEEKKQNVVKIDEYVIYENEGPDDEDDESDNSVNLDMDNDEEFTEKSKKNEKKSKFTTKYLKKNERIINFPMKNCLICSKDQSGNNELLNFKSIEDFLNYLKKTYDLNDPAINTEVEEYQANKNAFRDYFKNFHKHYNSDYVFKSIKYFCKPCFNHNLITKNGFDNLFTALHVSTTPNNTTNVHKKVDYTQQKPNKVPLENKTSNKEINIFFSTNPSKSAQNYNNIVQIPSETNINSIKNNHNDSVTNKLINDLTVKKDTKDIKLIETCDRLELNPEIKLNERDNNIGNNNINKIIDIISSNNKPINNNFPSNNQPNLNNNNTNPLLKLLNIMNPNAQNSNPSNNNNLIMNNPLMNQLNNAQSSLPAMPSCPMNNNNNVSSLVNILQNLNSNPQLQPNNSNSNNVLFPQMNAVNNNAANLNNLNPPNLNCNQQSQNLNHITNNIGKLVEIISQYNQKHLNQNASMLSNINSLVNTMSNIAPLESKTTNTQSKIEAAPQESIKDNTGEKKDNRQENYENNINNEHNHLTNEEKKDISGLLLNFDASKNNLSSYMFNVLDELKKQIYSIQYYSLVQKLFISYIFKNLDIFIEQLANNQALNNLNSNNLFKGMGNPLFNNYGENMNSLSDQLSLLKKIAENLALNQMNNPLLNSSNLEELNTILGNTNPMGQFNQAVNNSLNQNNINFNNVNSLLNIPIHNNPPNNSFNNIPAPLNTVGNVNPIKNNQNISTIFNKEGKNTDNINNANSINTPNNLNNQIPNLSSNNNNNQYQPINNNNQFHPQNNNMIDQILKGMKIQPQTHNPNSSHGQIIMPINIETTSTNIIQNPASQMYSLSNNQQQQPMNNNPSMLGNINNNAMSHNSLLFQLNSMMNPNGSNNGFGQSNLMNNPNLMNLLLQSNPNNITSQYPNNNNSNQKF